MKLLITFIGMALSHGRIMEPPGRSSLHRFPNDPAIAPFWADITPNYNDNELFCGGFWNQVSNDYRCGVCGDDYNEARPRSNELGGKYGSSGIIPRTYSSGQLIPIKIQITAHHRGYFQFKICKIESGQATEDEKCFNSNKSILLFKNGENKFSIDNYKPEGSTGSGTGYWYDMEVRLPEDLECNHCVLQWRYHTGNNWGSDENGEGLGHGYQEEFYGCSDIEIINTSGSTPTTSTQATVTTTEKDTLPDAETTQATQTKSTTTEGKTSSTQPATTISGSGFCENKQNGLYPHEKCSKFYNCFGGFTHVMACPPNLYFNPRINVCDWPSNVDISTCSI